MVRVERDAGGGQWKASRTWPSSSASAAASEPRDLASERRNLASERRNLASERRNLGHQVGGDTRRARTGLVRFEDEAALRGLTTLAKAHRRVAKFAGHLCALSPSATALEATRGGGALVPQPGTWAYARWLETLNTFPEGTRGGQVLAEWTAFFHASGPAIGRALRRFLVISAHLSAPVYTTSVQPVDVW